MGKIIAPVLHGVPAALVVALAYLVLIHPTHVRLEETAATLTGEIMPAVRELKQGIQTLEEARVADQGARRLAELAGEVSRALALAEAQERAAQGIQASVGELHGAFRELQARVGELKVAEPEKEDPAPADAKRFAQLSRKLTRALSLLEGQENRVRGVAVVLQTVMKRQAIGVTETQQIRNALGKLEARLDESMKLVRKLGVPVESPTESR